MLFACRATAPVADDGRRSACPTKKRILVCYSQRTFPFKQGRMGVIKAAVERVWCEIAQVFFAKLAQRLTQGLRLSHCRTCECVRVVFKTARPDVNDWRNPESYRPRQERKQQHRRNEICSGKSCLMLETERVIKPVPTRQPGDRGKRHNNASHGNAKHLDYVALFVMANFMREHGFQLRLGELCDQCVKQDDFSKSSESSEEGVGVSRAFAAIHHLDAARGKTSAPRQHKQPLAQLSFGQRRELVEKRHDDRRRN